MKTGKRILSILIVCCLIAGMLPVITFAVETDWKQAYWDTLQEYPESTSHSYTVKGTVYTYYVDTEYALYDIDENGIPELIVRQDLDEYYIYTFTGNATKLHGPFYWSYDPCLYEYDGNGIIIWDGGMGNQHFEYVYLCQLNNGELVDGDRIVEGSTAYDYEDVRNYLSGCEPIDDYCAVHDNSLLSDYSYDVDYVWLDELRIVDSDRYTGNMGDSFIDKIGTRNGTVDVEGNDYEHGLEAWIARWNYKNESSWAWCIYNLDGNYDTLSGTIGILNGSYNKTNFNTTLEIWGDNTLLYSLNLFPNMSSKTVDLNVTGVKTLKISLYDNESVSGGTSFALGDFRLYSAGTWDTQNTEPTIANTITDETILRAKLLTTDNSFRFYRDWDSPVQVMAQQLDPVASSSWYLLENLLDVYYQAAKEGSISSANVAKVTVVEFYEYLLLKLLDNEEVDYLTLTEPFELIDDISDGAVDTALLKKLVSQGFKAGTKITDKDKSAIKNACVAICGTDSILDIGWLDTILVSGKTISEFVSEFVTLYQLTTVSDMRTEAIRLIGQTTRNEYLGIAADNVCTSIQRAKEDGIEYCVSGGLEKSIDSVITWLLGKIVDEMCELHPASALWKKTADTTTFLMDTVLLTDDVSTDTIYISAMANIENTIKASIDETEAAFKNQETLENAQRLIALADCYKKELLVGCDLVENLVDHCERGNLNWNGILDLLNMAKEKKLDFGATLKWIFGDSDSSYAHLRESVTSIKKSIETTNFYAGSVSVLELLREVESITPSVWAKSEIEKAIGYDILPDWMQNNYQNNITRLEFCALLEYMIEQKTGKTVAILVEERGSLIRPPFDDALYMEANDIACLGIINGVGNNNFNPLGEITRQEAATMLYRTASVLGYDTTSKATNHNGVADWAVQGVDFVMTQNIMNGTENGFEPNGTYTKEQAIATMVRFYENV